MADDQPSDEQVLYKAFQQVADVLLPLKQELRARAHAMVGAFLGLAPSDTGLADVAATRPAGPRNSPSTRIASREPPSPKDFLFQKQPTTDVERVACLAFYLTHYCATPQFKTIDISKLNTEAAQRKLSNAAATVGTATRDGYLAPAAKKGMTQLAAEGERYVDELPNRAAARAAFGKRKARRGRRSSNAGKGSTATQALGA